MLNKSQLLRIRPAETSPPGRVFTNEDKTLRRRGPNNENGLSRDLHSAFPSVFKIPSGPPFVRERRCIFNSTMNSPNYIGVSSRAE